MIVRGSVIVAVVLLALCFYCEAIQLKKPATFSWSDCGVQLYKDIHYEVASIDASNNLIQEGGTLSVNVKATIADTVYNAQTRLMVWKDGELFMDVYIDDLCDIISTTKGLSCPLPVGEISFTYKFEEVPTLPSGYYVVDIKSETLEGEIGCIEFVGVVDGRDADPSCYVDSSFEVRFKGSPIYSQENINNRTIGDLIQIGPVGKLVRNPPPSFGVFVGDYVGTPDLGGSIPTTDYLWSLNGTLLNRTGGDLYYGTFYVWHRNGTTFTPAFVGIFNLTFDSSESVWGTMWLNPAYMMLDWLDWPTVIGNLAPFQITTSPDSNLLAKGKKTFCTCGEDACGVCGGDGTACGLGEPEEDEWWYDRRIVAVTFGIAGFLVLLLVAELSRRVHRARRRVPNDDTDLLDHPEKPDYGTMAIDDAIREGERA